MEREFFEDMAANFWGCGGQVLLHRIPLPAGSPLDTGDQGIWHGIYTAMLALRYSATAGTATGSKTEQNLLNAQKGLRLHQTAHGESKPRLIRGVSDDLSTWEDNASNDTATGHLLGIYFGWKYGPQAMQPMFAELAENLALELVEHNNALVRADGRPTTYGALEQGWKSDPLRITLAMAIHAVAYTVGGRVVFKQHYEKLLDKYRAIIPYPKVKLFWLNNHNDTHRAAIHLMILADVTLGLRDEVAMAWNGLERIQSMVAKEANVWVNALTSWHGHWTARIRKTALTRLSEFDLESKRSNEGRDNYKSLTVGPVPFSTWWFKPVLWDGKWMANQVLPPWVMMSQDFHWQRNPFSLNEGTLGRPADSRLNCGDWLCAYWLSRELEIIKSAD